MGHRHEFANSGAALEQSLSDKKKKDARKLAYQSRKMRDQAMKDIGMVKVKSDSGKVYYE